ncbi:MAG TPA: BlaI/MecI/CopY family transcriptional regulator [Acidobacteriaceae bacterium]|jgi:predicted transcriptional regulator|nr:BlaI/MecI/CopY family transcriptional regulator [Acidobacteriaceae bacterium]
MTVVIDEMTAVIAMPAMRLSKLEIQILETVWARGEASIREMQEAFPARKRPGYTTVQTMVYRLETKKALRRVRRLGNFHIFKALVSREEVQRTLVDELLAMFGGESRPVVARLIETGNLTLEDVEYAEKTLKELKRGGKS